MWLKSDESSLQGRERGWREKAMVGTQGWWFSSRDFRWGRWGGTTVRRAPNLPALGSLSSAPLPPSLCFFRNLVTKGVVKRDSQVDNEVVSALSPPPASMRRQPHHACVLRPFGRTVGSASQHRKSLTDVFLGIELHGAQQDSCPWADSLKHSWQRSKLQRCQHNRLPVETTSKQQPQAARATAGGSDSRRKP